MFLTPWLQRVKRNRFRNSSRAAVRKRVTRPLNGSAELLEDRTLLSGLRQILAVADVAFGETEVDPGPIPAVWTEEPVLADAGHEPDPLTLVLDFNDPAQANTTDIFGNTVTTFDVTTYGFVPGDFNLVTSAVLDTVRQHYFSIPTSEANPMSPLPPGMDLALDIVIGDFGTPPANGATEYYYLQIGSNVAAGGPLGVAGLNAIRDSAGNPSGLPVGSIVGSIFTDNIQGLGGLTPPNALTSGNVFFTSNAIGGTTSHEGGHAFSLLHLNRAGSVTPNGLPPIMGTGAIDLPNQDRINDREFAISGQNAQAGGATQFHIQQLINAIGLHPSEDLGDAPDSYGTLRGSSGARHISRGPMLGAGRDVEADANPTADATGDDSIGSDDEDGVMLPATITEGQTVGVQVTSSAGGGELDYFVDFDQDGTFGNNPNEVFSATLTGGTETVMITVPTGATVGPTFARFRISTAGGLGPTSAVAADDGEVEDYMVTVLPAVPIPPTITLGGSSGTETDDLTQSFTWDAIDFDGDLDTVGVTVTQDGSTIFSSTAASGTFNFDARGLGDFVMTVTASDLTGATSNDTRSVTVTDDDANGPTITLGGSSGLELLTAAQQFTWNITDASGVAGLSVTVTQDGVPIFTDTVNPTGSFNFDAFGLGTFVMSVSATDADADWVGDDSGSSSARVVTVVSEISSAFSFFIPAPVSRLQVELEEAGNVTLTAAGGFVLVNGANPTTGPLLAADVLGIVVHGGQGPNVIDLSQVTAADFTGLNCSITVFGSDGNDTITASPLDGVYFGGHGDDLIIGDIGADTVDGGDGHDTLLGNGAADSILGGDGNDSIEAGDGDDFVDAGDGQDFVDGGDGNDDLRGGNGADTIAGGLGNDTLNGGAGLDLLNGDTGNDRLLGGADEDTLFGDAGNDTLRGQGGDDTLDGGIGDDNLNGQAGNDLLLGGTGADTLRGNGGVDFLDGGDGNDELNGNGRADTLIGNDGSDTLFGGAGADELFGDGAGVTISLPGDDVVRGQGGNDTLIGGGEADLLDGGTGDDLVQSDVSTLTIDNVTVDPEGTGGTNFADFTVTLTRIGFDVVTVDVMTMDGSAVDTMDYTAVNMTLVFLPGETTKTVSVPITTDAIDEFDENFFLNLTNATNARIADSQGEALIVNDDLRPGGILITPTNDPATLVNAVTAAGGSGITVTGFNLQAPPAAGGGQLSTGTYTVGTTLTYGLQRPGIVISTGDVADYETGPNTSTGTSTAYGVPATPAQELLLDPITGGPFDHNDVTQLDIQFDMLPGFDTLFFEVVFGSEEFPEFVGSFIDGFGLFVNGTNVAFAGTPPNPINIDHPDMSAIPGTELDGVLAPGGNAVLQFSAFVGDGVTGNSLTFIIADTVDTALDTTAYIGSLGGTLPGMPQPPMPPDMVGDTLRGGDGDDTILGASGADTLSGQAGNDSLDGGGNDDILLGGGSNDTLNGNAGADTLDGQGAADVLFGDVDVTSIGFNPSIHVGNDVLLWDGTTGDELDGGLGFDELQVNTGTANDTITASTSGSRLVVNARTPGDSVGETISTTGFEMVSINTNSGRDEVIVGDLSAIVAVQLVQVDAGSGHDVIDGSAQRDNGLVMFLNGGDGRDTLIGGDGEDIIDGQAGDDSLVGGDGDDALVGGDGRDTLEGSDGNDMLDGTAHSDVLRGDNGNDTLDGGMHDDTLSGGNDNDLLLAGFGDDVAFGYNGDDTLMGGDGDDSLNGEGGNDSILGEGGADSLAGGDDQDTLLGGADGDRLEGGAGNDLLSGELDDDHLNGNAGDDVAMGNDGNDTVLGGAGNDDLLGNDGRDVLSGNAGADSIRGGNGEDTLKGGGHNDTLNGGDGDDLLQGDIGADALAGHDGDDTLNGGGDVDTLIGGNGDDTLRGGAAGDFLVGGQGGDNADGQGSVDTISGGQGQDTITGVAEDVVDESIESMFDPNDPEFAWINAV